MLLDPLEELWRAAQRYEALAPTGLRTAPQVFISYAHDSAEHRDSVVRFAELLLRNGVDMRLDQWDQGIRRDWSRWVVDQLMTADFVLVVASPGYRDAAQGAANSSKGRGASFEAAVLRDSLQRDRAFHFRRILPVLLPGGSADDIPLFLQPYTGAYYRVAEFTVEGAEALLRTLTDQPAIVPPPLGQVPALPPMAVPAMAETVEATPMVSEERSPLLPDLGTSWAVLVGVAGYRPDVDYTAVSYDSVRDLLSAGRAKRSVVVLASGEPGTGEYGPDLPRVRRRALEEGFPVPQQMARGGRELALTRNPAFGRDRAAGPEPSGRPGPGMTLSVSRLSGFLGRSILNHVRQ